MLLLHLISSMQPAFLKKNALGWHIPGWSQLGFLFFSSFHFYTTPIEQEIAAQNIRWEMQSFNIYQHMPDVEENNCVCQVIFMSWFPKGIANCACMHLHIMLVKVYDLSLSRFPQWMPFLM